MTAPTSHRTAVRRPSAERAAHERARRAHRAAEAQPRHGPRAPVPGASATTRLAAQQLAVAAGQLAAGAGNLLFAVIAAHVLAPGAFADMAAFLALYLLIHVPAGSLAAGSALDPDLAARLRRRVLRAGAAAGAALAVLSVPLGALLDVSPGLPLAAAAAAPAAGLIALDRGRLYGLGRHARAVGSLLAEPAVRLLLGVALAALAGPVGGAAAIVTAGWAALAVAHLPGSAVVPRPAGRPAAIRPAPAVAAFLLLAVVQNQDVLLAGALLGEQEAARFAVVSTLGGAAAFASTTVPLMLLPRSGAGSTDALKVAVAVAAVLGGAAAAAVAVSPHELIAAVFGARYAAAGAIAVPYVLAMALLGVARVLVAQACATLRPAVAVGLLGAAAVLHLVLLVVLGDDAAGVATATLAATGALTAGAAAAVGRHALVRAAQRTLAFARRRDVALVAGLTLAGVALRLLTVRGIWLDEATSVKQAEMPLGAMLGELGATDVHPPLHHLILWATVRLLGTGEAAVRLPSLLAAAALIPVLYLAGRDVYDRRAGLAAATLGTVAPFAVWYAQEARMYALFMLLALLAAWLQVRIVRDRRARDWLAYTAVAAALIYTQYFGILLVGVQQLGFLATLRARRGDPAARRADALAWAGWSCALVLLLVPLMPFAMGQFDANEAAGKGFQQVPSQTAGSLGESQQPPGAYAAITNVLWALLGYHSDGTMTAMAALWPLLMLLALALLGRGRSRRTLLLAATAALPAVALLALGQLKPFVFEVRYFIGAVPLLLLLIGRAATSWTARPPARWAACAAAAAALALGLADQQLNGSNPRVYDFKGALTSLKQRARPGDVVVYAPPYLDTVVGYYGEGLNARPLEDGLPEPARGRRVFVLGSFFDKPQFRAQTADAVRRLRREHRLVARDERPQIRIWEFRR